MFASCLVAPVHAADRQVPEVSCEDLGRFAHGEFDQAPDLFGIPKLEWSKPMAWKLADRSRSCRDAMRAELIAKHMLTPDRSSIVERWYSATTQKALAFAADMERARSSAQQEAQRAQARAEEAAAAQEKARLDACRDTTEYKRFAAAEDVVEAVEYMAAVRHDQRQERRVSRESGVRNLSEEYENGSRMVAAQDDLRSAWAEYKAEGGKAASPQKVQRLPDPCGAAATPP